VICIPSIRNVYKTNYLTPWSSITLASPKQMTEHCIPSRISKRVKLNNDINASIFLNNYERYSRHGQITSQMRTRRKISRRRIQKKATMRKTSSETVLLAASLVGNAYAFSARPPILHKARMRKYLPYVFQLEIIIAIELHKEAHGPQIRYGLGCLAVSGIDDAGSSEFHHGIVNSV